MHRFSCLLVIAMSGLFSACDRNDSNLTPTQPAESASHSSNSVSPQVVIPDQSLPAADYITLGLPSYDRPWIGQDMAVAASKLQSLSPEKLPRFNSSRSGQVFARIVARDNLNFFRTGSLPIEIRISSSLDYLGGISAIIKLYASAFMANKATGDDLIELMGANLQAVQVVRGTISTSHTQ